MKKEKFLAELDAYALDTSKVIASKALRQIRIGNSNIVAGMSADDLASEAIAEYLKIRDSIDAKSHWQGFISQVMYRKVLRVRNEICEIHSMEVSQSSLTPITTTDLDKEETMNNVDEIFGKDDEDAFAVLVKKHDAKRLANLRFDLGKEVKKYCLMFNSAYDKDDLFITVYKLVYKVLSESSEAEWDRLHPEIKHKITNYAIVLQKIDSRIYFDNDFFVPSLIDNLDDLVREFIMAGFTTSNAIRQELKRRKMDYDWNELIRTVHRVRKQLGLGKVIRKNSAKAIIQDYIVNNPLASFEEVLHQVKMNLPDKKIKRISIYNYWKQLGGTSKR